MDESDSRAGIVGFGLLLLIIAVVSGAFDANIGFVIPLAILGSTICICGDLAPKR